MSLMDLIDCIRVSFLLFLFFSLMPMYTFSTLVEHSPVPLVFHHLDIEELKNY